MDFLRKFIETAFCFYDCDLTRRIMKANQAFGDNALILDKDRFVSTLRRRYPQISDDSIQLIYRKFKDDWCKHPQKTIADKNLFYALIHFTKEVLRTEGNDCPVVLFEQLFKWKEVTEITGETALVCAFLAYNDSLDSLNSARNDKRNFNWPNLLLTDNRLLRYIFKENRLIDLHQHLKASTSTFGISWTCLMNHISRRSKQFEFLANDKAKSRYYYDAVILAAKIRMAIYQRIMQSDKSILVDINEEIDKLFLTGIARNRKQVHFLIDRLRTETRQCQKCFVYDYAASDNHEITAVFEGERQLLYAAFKHVFDGDKLFISHLLYRYLLIKSIIRAEMVQFNANVGFANFTSFEQKKEIFIEDYREYADLLFILPMYEVRTHYYQDEIETRIAPQASYRKIRQRYNRIKKLQERYNTSAADYRLIYHFIKKKEQSSGAFGLCRNFHTREEIKKQTSALYKLQQKKSVDKVIGIDAANSEFFCRPEVFAQAYERLSSCHLNRTFHVGEDFYDLADGLRAIDEAIQFLNLRRGDRLGHCLALGIQPESYYAEHDYHLAIPRQVLTDDVVWLKMKSMEWNVPIPPRVEKQIIDFFNSGKENQFSMEDYYEAMRLRKESPRKYIHAETDAQQIYQCYHYDSKQREKGEIVEDFKIFPEYVSFIQMMQDKMMEYIEDKQLVIECCPSSNVKVGRLKYYDCHPIFRFCEIRDEDAHHLPVTISTDDLGIFYTSLPREYELLALALLKKKDRDGNPVYRSQEIYNWVERIVKNAHIYKFH